MSTSGWQNSTLILIHKDRHRRRGPLWLDCLYIFPVVVQEVGRIESWSSDQVDNIQNHNLMSSYMAVQVGDLTVKQVYNFRSRGQWARCLSFIHSLNCYQCLLLFQSSIVYNICSNCFLVSLSYIRSPVHHLCCRLDILLFSSLKVTDSQMNEWITFSFFPRMTW